MRRALLLAMLALPVGATCLVERHGWQTWVCDTDAEKPATGNREGDHVWAKDTNKLYYWDGAAWLQIGAGGGGGAPTTATYITQTPDATLSAEQAMSLLGTGITINTTGTGVQSIYAGSSCGAGTVARSESAAGALTCTAVALTADVNGKLPPGNGGTGQDTSATPDDSVLVAAGGGAWATTVVSDCPDSSGQHVNYDAASNTFTCGSSSSGGAGANVVTADLDFGSSGNTSAAIVVTGQAWVTGTSKIVCAPTLYATSSRSEGADDAFIEGLVVGVSNRVVGTGFTIKGGVQRGEAFGVFTVNCLGS